MPGSFVERTEFLRGAQTTVSRIMANTTTDAFCSSSLVCVVDRDELVRTRLKGVLQRLGVVVRPMDGYGLPDHVRITVGTPEENERCVCALKTVLGARV